MKKDLNEKVEILILFGIVISFALILFCYIVQKVFDETLVILASISFVVLFLSVTLLAIELIVIFVVRIIEVLKQMAK